MTSKQELRQYIRSRNHGDRLFDVKSDDFNQKSVPAIASLLSHPKVVAAHTILLYSALPDEVPTQTLMDELVVKGKTVLLPKVVSDTDMVLHRYTGYSDLREGAYGIMEPTGEVYTDYEQIEVGIIPGMAFDQEGHRLGRGKGYYDRFLSRVPCLYKIGLCFSWQLLDHVPTDEHDIIMDEVVVWEWGMRNEEWGMKNERG